MIRVFVAALLTVGASMAQTGWKAGVATIVITPKEPILMAGYAERTTPSRGVLLDLKAKALALQDETGSISVIVTMDQLTVNREVAASVAEAVQQKHGLPRARLMFNASHTHSGPVVGLNVVRSQMDRIPEEYRVVIVRYSKFLAGQLVEVIGKAIADLAPARLSFEQTVAGFGVNRRRGRNRALPAPVDHDVPVLSVRDPAGKLRAVVFGYACHNTVLNGYEINGDYAGFAQQEIERTYPGATAMFMEGCGADINPLPRRSVELAKTYGWVLATAVGDVLKGRMRAVEGPLKAEFQLVDVSFRKPPGREELEADLKSSNPQLVRRANRLLEQIKTQGSLADHYPYPVQVYQFGRGMTLIALGGEVVVDYSLRLKRELGFDNTWVAGYSNDVFAYIPSVRVLKEGGYEGGEGPNIPYGLATPFSASVEETIVEKVHELVRRALPAVASK